MKVLQLPFLAVLFSIGASTRPKVKYGKFSVSKHYFWSFLNEACILYKPDYEFTARAVPPGTNHFKVEVGEKLFKKNTRRSAVCSSDSTVSVMLPPGKSLTDYLAFIVSNWLSYIGEFVKNGEFNQHIADEISKAYKVFPYEQCTDIKQRHVYVNAVELDDYLQTNFLKTNEAKTKKKSTANSDRLIRKSILFIALDKLPWYSIYVYIPSDQTLHDFVTSVIPKVNRFTNVVDVAWNSLLAALKSKDCPNVRRINVKYLLKQLCLYQYEGYLDNIAPLEIIPDATIVPDRWMTKINFPRGIGFEITLHNCDKFYFDFGMLPVRDESLSDFDILQDMVKTIYPTMKKVNQLYALMPIIQKLQSKSGRQAYGSHFISDEIIQLTDFTVSSLNETVAEYMNSIKIPIHILPTDIVEPPSESDFTIVSNSKKYQYYVNNQFPVTEYNILTDNDRLTFYIQFVKQKVADSNQNERMVVEQFCKNFWARETVAEFHDQFIQSIDFLKEEDEAAIVSEEQEMKEIEMGQALSKFWGTNGRRKSKETKTLKCKLSKSEFEYLFPRPELEALYSYEELREKDKKKSKNTSESAIFRVRGTHSLIQVNELSVVKIIDERVAEEVETITENEEFNVGVESTEINEDCISNSIENENETIQEDKAIQSTISNSKNDTDSSEFTPLQTTEVVGATVAATCAVGLACAVGAYIHNKKKKAKK